MQYRNLEVYKEAEALADELIDVGQQKFPVYEFNDQILRAGLSVMLNIAEGSNTLGLRHRANFYSIARGSVAECNSFLDLCARRQWIAPDLHASLTSRCDKISAMLFALIRNCHTR